MTNAVVETRRPDGVTTDEDKAKTKGEILAKHRRHAVFGAHGGGPKNERTFL